MTIQLTQTELKLDENHDRAVRAVQVAERFASIITRKDVKATLVTKTNVPAPAWSTGSSISFAESHIAGNLHTADGVLSMKGLTCHEVCHILYTPRSGTNIAGWVRDESLHRYFNMLEDMRIERMLVGRFGRAVVPWLTATVAQHLLNDPAHIATAFPLIHGRTYLPLELRVAVRQAYKKQDTVVELASVIDEYVRLVFPRNDQQGKALIKRYAELLGQLEAEGEDFGGDCGTTTEGFPSGDRPLKPTEQERDQQKADKRDDEEDDLEPGTQPVDKSDDESDDEGDQPTDAGDSTDDEGDDEGDDDSTTDGGWGGQPGDESDEDGDAGDEGSDDGDITGGTETDADASDSSDSDGDDVSDGASTSTGTGAGSGDSADQPDVTDVLDVLNDVLDNIKSENAESIHDTIIEILGGAELAGNGGQAPDASKFVEVETTLDARLSSNALARELEDLQTQFDPGWERETASGRLNVGRYLRGADIDETFDRWQSGRDDAVDIECVIVLDCSGSMSDNMGVASTSMWALKRALDKVGASTTVVTYSYGSSTGVLYRADEEATDKVRYVTANGGTSPLRALQHATNVLASSDRAVKVLFNITDGVWDEAESANELIATARRAGVLTSLAYVTAIGGTDIDAHESELVTPVTKTDDLFVLGRELVRIATARNLSVAR
jgi:hypothetical protein